MEESKELNILLDSSSQIEHQSQRDYLFGQQLPTSQKQIALELPSDNLLILQSSQEEQQLYSQTAIASQGILIHQQQNNSHNKYLQLTKRQGNKKQFQQHHQRQEHKEEILFELEQFLCVYVGIINYFQTNSKRRRWMGIQDQYYFIRNRISSSAQDVAIISSTEQQFDVTSNNLKDLILPKLPKLIEINQHTQIESITKQLLSSDFDVLSFKLFKGSIKSPCFKSLQTILKSQILNPIQTLEFLCSNCDLNSNDLSFILQSITTFKDLSLIKHVSLNLKSNRLNKRGILMISECIKSMGDYTKKWKIILSDNPKIQENHNSNHCEQLLESISLVNSLEELILDVSYTHINNSILIQSARILQVHYKTILIFHMIFDECLQLTQPALNQLLTVLSSAQDVMSFQLVSLGLGMDVMQITKDNRKLLIKIIKHHNISLTSLLLHLSYTRVTPQFFISLSEAISTLKNLQILELNGKGNQVDSITFRQIIQQSLALQNLINISLDFSINKILGVELTYLSQIIENLQYLKEIHVNLSNNLNFMRFPVALCETIQRKQLKGSLTIQECNIPEDVVRKISNMFSQFILNVDRQ